MQDFAIKKYIAIISPCTLLRGYGTWGPKCRHRQRRGKGERGLLVGRRVVRQARGSGNRWAIRQSGARRQTGSQAGRGPVTSRQSGAWRRTGSQAGRGPVTSRQSGARRQTGSWAGRGSMAGEVLERKRGGYQGFRLETEFKNTGRTDTDCRCNDELAPAGRRSPAEVGNVDWMIAD